jgi:uncharacterized protein (TIGR03118 family)
MLKHPPIHSFAKAACTIALALSSTHLRADTFVQVNLVSNVPGLAAVTDPNLKNPWGVSFSATSPFWVSNQVSGNATLYSGTGAINSLVVSIPPGTVPNAPSGPTGQVFNNAAMGFNVGTTKSNFIFDTLNGTIAAWNASAGTTAQVEATLPGAIFTGLTQANIGTTTYLYAANSAGNIQVYDSNWNNVTGTPLFFGKFADPNKSGAVPFNIQQIGANLYVTYANLTSTGGALPGGYVVEYDANGNFIQEITSGPLAAPWGITIAPANFGAFSNDLLIGQFGDGQILAYNPLTDAFLGVLDDANGQPIVDHGLWALETRTVGSGDNPNAVFFTAGINGETNGLFGEITEVPEPSTILGTATGLIAFATMKIRSRRR